MDNKMCNSLGHIHMMVGRQLVKTRKVTTEYDAVGVLINFGVDYSKLDYMGRINKAQQLIDDSDYEIATPEVNIIRGN